MPVKTINYTGGNSHNVDYRAARKCFAVPSIDESYIDDNGEVQHILHNGNTISNERYTASFGKPIIKGVIKKKGYKGRNPDGTKISR